MTDDVLDQSVPAIPLAGSSGILTGFEWAVLGLTLVAAAPFLFLAYPPIADMPNHVARLFLECHRADPALAKVFTVRPALIPDVSMDLVNVALCGLAPPDLVFKAMLVGSLGAICVSAIVIQRKAFGGPSIGLLVVPATALNLVTVMGYVNYLSGVAVLFIMVALLIDRMEQRRLLWLVSGVGGVILLLCHIIALALGMAVVFGLQIRGRLTLRKIFWLGGRTVLLFLPALVLFALSEKPDHTFFIDIGNKLLGPIYALLKGEPNRVQAFVGAALVLFLSVLAFRRAKNANAPLLMASVVAVICAFLLPWRIGDAVDLDSRTWIAAIVLLAIALPPKPRAAGSIPVAFLSLVLLGLHLQTQSTRWARFSAQVSELRAAADAIPQGARVLSVVADMDHPKPPARAAAYTHLASYTIVDRKAFDPLEFVGRGMQPLSVAPALEAINPRGPTLPLTVKEATAMANWVGPPNATLVQDRLDYAILWPRKFDRVLYYHFGGEPNFDASQLYVVKAGSFFSILAPKEPISARP